MTEPFCFEQERPQFKEPWEAQVFALVLHLHEKGAFTWPQWAQALGEAIAKAQLAGDPDTGDTYYRHWMVALESLATSQQLLSASDLALRQQAWQDAAKRTPHGQPIELHRKVC
jgi:nitrile hydratase accessory protein